MSLGLRCPACQKRMSVPDHALGRRVQCPSCESTFRYTGQKEVTLGRVRARSEMAMAAPPLARAGHSLGDLEIREQMQTMPVIDLPEMPALLEKFKRPVAEEPELVDDAEEAFDLEMFHATPVETVLPEVSEAEIEALFLEEEPGGEARTHPGARSTDSTLPIASVPHALPADPMAVEEVEEIVDAEPFIAEDDIVDAEPATMEVVEEIVDIEALEAEEEMVEVARIDPGETLPWKGGSPADAPVEHKREAATKHDLDLGAGSAEAHVDDIEEIIEDVVEEFDDAPVAVPPTAAPIAKAALPIAAALPAGSVPMAGVLKAHLVPGQVVQGSIVASAAPLAAPLIETLPYASRLAPVSDEPIPPPTPPAKTPIADDDLDALFREVLGDDASPADVVEELHSDDADMPDPFTTRVEVPALEDDDVVEEIHELEPDLAFEPPAPDEPVVEELVEEVAEEDLDLMALFADEPAALADVADVAEPVVESFEDDGFAIEDDPPAKKSKK